ncbi:Shedu anti-phage system protein SduA domain-containing protein [Paenibacillus sp. FSL L8-0708]|uniref:Shedu anti-phage system protein SduA domain-containing protein n=1 Tax=Paenibacillus sp. FSL L8-0708 TaxID=2975311 RepID=UPI0030FC327E
MRRLDLEKFVSKEITHNYYSRSFNLFPHQLRAICDVQNAIKEGKKSIVLEMRIGSGKTVLACVLSKLFYECNAERILYVTYIKDTQPRIEVVFNENLRNQYSIFDEDENWQNSRIVIATYEQLLRNNQLRSIDFDVVICDDIEIQSLYKIFHYYIGYIVGFTSLNDDVYLDKNRSVDAIYTYSLRDELRYKGVNDLTEISSSHVFKEIHKRIAVMKQTLSIKSTTVADVEGILHSLNAINDVLKEHHEVFGEYIKQNIKVNDITSLAYKRDQLTIFSKLLDDGSFFIEQKQIHHNSSERVWQTFFENNTWIFGYGLNYFLGSPLENKKFEQVIKGSSFSNSGKRIDALMKSMGSINSMCFVEIKTHETPLLNKKQYRNSWAISGELSGAIAQIQYYKYSAIKSISSKIEITGTDGDPTGEVIYNYNPKAILLIGNLAQFNASKGVNESKLSSFEIFRKSIEGIEIITFDELYERAKFIIEV